MQYVYALNPVCIVLIILDTPAEKFPVRAGHKLIREYNDDSSYLTYINNISQYEISTFV